MIKKHYYLIPVIFKVIDAVAVPILYLLPDQIYINGTSVNFTYSNNTVFLDGRFSGVVTISIEKQGYITETQTVLVNYLNGMTISMTPDLSATDCTIKLSWNQDESDLIDFDSHLLIYNNLTKVTEIYYQNRTYTDSEISAQLDHDDGAGEGDYGGNETTTVIPLYNGYTYAFVVLDYNAGCIPRNSLLTSRNTKCTINIGNTTQVISAPTSGDGQFWNVFEINTWNNGVPVVTSINTITRTNDYGITKSGCSQFTVLYDANSGTGTVPQDSNSYYSYDSVTVLSGSTLSRTGYVFNGWNTAADGSGTHYDSGDTFDISGNTTLYAQWDIYTATVISTNNCEIAIDGVVDGSKLCTIGSNISGITTTVNANYELYGYLIHPSVGNDWEVLVGNSIVMPACSITITPECQLKPQYVNYTMLGYGNDKDQCVEYDVVNLQLTNNYKGMNTFTAQADGFKSCWGNFNITSTISGVPYGIAGNTGNVPYLSCATGDYHTSRVGSGTIGNTINFAFGFSEDETTYSPYGFIIEESITDASVRTTIVQGLSAKIKERQGGDTTNAVYYSMTLLYPTNIKCLYVTNS